MGWISLKRWNLRCCPLHCTIVAWWLHCFESSYVRQFLFPWRLSETNHLCLAVAKVEEAHGVRARERGLGTTTPGSVRWMRRIVVVLRASTTMLLYMISFSADGWTDDSDSGTNSLLSGISIFLLFFSLFSFNSLPFDHDRVNDIIIDLAYGECHTMTPQH